MSIHPTALIAPGAALHPTVAVGPYCVIEDGVEIGGGTILKSFVELRAGTVIGRYCYIDSGVKSSGDCVIEDDVTLRYDTILARGCHIGAGSYLCPRVMTINLDHRREEVGGAHIGMRCFIGTHAVLQAGITLVDGVIVGACSLVTKSCLDAGVYLGTPARLRPLH